MKQTIAILCALTAALLVMSGFILSSSLQQTQLLAEKDALLATLQEEKNELVLERRTLAQQNDSLGASLQKVTKERDALTTQLNDAVLSSQEANDALAARADEADTLRSLLAESEAALDELFAVHEQTLAELDALSASCLMHEAQSREDAAAIAALSAEIETLQQALASPSPTPLPTEPFSRPVPTFSPWVTLPAQ